MRVNLCVGASRLLSAAVLLGACPATAQDYPSSVEAAPLIAWLEKSTNISPATVVSITSELVVAIVGKTMPASAGGPVRLTLREEVIAPAAVGKIGGRSSLMTMEIHCEERRLRMDERRLYDGASLSGAMEVTEPSADWFRIPDGSIMDEIAQAACSDNFAWPLRLAGQVAAPRGLEVAAMETPLLTLPPGPDAKPVEDEPPAPPQINTAVAEPEPAAPPPEPESPEPASEALTSPAEPTEQEKPAPTPKAEAAPEPRIEAIADVQSQTPGEAPPAGVEGGEITDPAPTPVEPAEPPAPLASEELVAPDAPDPEKQAPASAGPAFLVQIGAYKTTEMAEAAWAELSASRPIVVEGLSFDIRHARVKGKDWLRGLVGPFATRGEARAFCSALAGSKYGCILRIRAD